MAELLEESETKEIVTPYAFSVSPKLLGEPLASPTRRGIAIVIDVFLIGVLSTIGTLIFAAFVALTFFRADIKIKQRAETNQKGGWHYSRLLLRGSGAIIIFAVAFTLVKSIDNEHANEDVTTGEAGIKIAELVILLACNDDFPCAQKAGQEIATGLANTDISEAEFSNKMRDVISDTKFTEEQKESVLTQLSVEFLQARSDIADNVSVLPEDSQNEKSTEETQTTPGIIAWVKNIMADLGLGLGWAALYFSVFTAWAKGQTIGKKICSIKVVRLDGNTPTLWESFNRYGGYGAGFATGLLGFLQLFWDPNRQGIHDKISETLVLRVKKPAKLKKGKVAAPEDKSEDLYAEQGDTDEPKNITKGRLLD